MHRRSHPHSVCGRCPPTSRRTLGSITESLSVEIAGKVFAGVENLDGTWKLPAAQIVALPAGTYDVKVTAKNAIGLVGSDSTTDELTIATQPGGGQ